MKLIGKIFLKLVLLAFLIPAGAWGLGFTQACTHFIGHAMGPTDWAVFEAEGDALEQSHTLLNALRLHGYCCYVLYFADKGWMYNLGLFMEQDKEKSLAREKEVAAARERKESIALDDNLEIARNLPIRGIGEFDGWSRLKKADDWLQRQLARYRQLRACAR